MTHSTNPIPRYAFACLVIVQGCAGLHGGAGAARSAPAGECAQEAALPKELLEPGSVLLFGETHGTEELPRFFGEAVSRRGEGMASNIAAHARAFPGPLTMALTGEVHAWEARGAPWNPDLLPMGWHLDQAGIRVRSLGRATPSGTAWICTGGSSGDCGSKETRATGTLPSGRTAGIELLPDPSPRGNDGMYATSSLTASPPARSSHLPPRGPS